MNRVKLERLYSGHLGRHKHWYHFTIVYRQEGRKPAAHISLRRKSLNGYGGGKAELSILIPYVSDDWLQVAMAAFTESFSFFWQRIKCSNLDWKESHSIINRNDDRFISCAITSPHSFIIWSREFQPSYKSKQGLLERNARLWWGITLF